MAEENGRGRAIGRGGGDDARVAGTEWRTAPARPQRNGTLVLPLPARHFGGLPAARSIDGIELARKDEFHATLVDAACADALDALDDPEQAWARLCGFAAELDWRFRRRGESHLVRHRDESGERHSIIEAIEQPAQQRFRDRLSQCLGRPLPPPFPHVTLFVTPGTPGIGLFDPDSFRARQLRRID